MGEKDKDFFVGFGSFHCRTYIWKPFFPETKIGKKKLRDSLSIDVIEEINKEEIKVGEGWRLASQALARKISGAEPWGKYAGAFLGYNKEYEKRYYDRWGKLKFPIETCRNIFEAFRESVPEEKNCKEEHKKYLEPARKILEYLSEVERYFALPLSEYDEAWLNAGMYVLICLFLQNCKDEIPEYREPPEKYSLLRLRALIANNGEEPPEEAKPEAAGQFYKAPDGAFHSPELEEALPFDLFAQAEAFFEKKGGSTRYQPFDPVITPAEVRRKRVPYSKTCTVGEAFGTYRTGYFFYEDFLIGEEPDGDTEYLGHRARFAPSTSDGVNRSFRLEGTCFEDKTMEAFELIVEDRSEGFYIFPLRFDDHTVGPVFVENAIRIDIDSYGYPIKHSMDRLMKSYQIREELQPCPGFRRYAVPLKREYLNYQIINAETMEVLPMQRSRDRQGQEQLIVVIPSPCKLVILNNEPTALTEEERLLFYFRGYMHGVYGLKKSLFQARLELEAGLYHTDRRCACQCAFQYGVYMRTQGNAAAAEEYLRRAAEDLPGARFELAMLLLERDPLSPEGEELLESLWAEGYRYYGLTSIDLLNKHQPQ